MINFSDYTDFFIFLGGLLIIGGVIYFFLRRFFKNIFISEEEISRLRILNQASTHKISKKSKNTDSQILLNKLTVILLIIIIGGFLLNQFLMWKMNSSSILNKLLNINISVTRK